MSQLSLDSLDNYSSSDDKLQTRLTKDRGTSTTYDNVGEFGGSRGVNDPFILHRTVRDNFDKDTGFNERTKVEVENPTKFRGNALIASTNEAFGKSVSTEKKLTVTPVWSSNFRAKRYVPKKFDVARRSSSFTSTSTSSAEFRPGVSQLPARNRRDDARDSVKTGKKLGEPRRVVPDTEKKKPVSYLELHRRKFGAENRRCIPVPEGTTPSICDDRTDERVGRVDEEATAGISRDHGTGVRFHRRATKLRSSESRETRSCESSDRFETYDGATGPSDGSECFSDGVRTFETRRRILYKPYSIEDYRCLTVPQPDRSLGPDRIEMESKAEWLMRRRSYGDSVSSRNRQRILHRAQKFKESRRADVEKLRLPPLTDPENPTPASKVDDKQERVGIDVREKRSNRCKSVQTKKVDERASRVGKLPPVVSESKSILPKAKIEAKATSGFPDLYETGSDTTDDWGHLRRLQLRHLEEKKRVDRIFKRGLCA